MLQELLQQEKQKLTAIIRKKEGILNQKAELDKKIRALESEVTEIFEQLGNLKNQLIILEEEQRTHPIKSFVTGKGRQVKEIRDEIEVLSVKYAEKHIEYEDEKKTAQAKIREYQEIEDAEKELGLMQSDKNYVIKKLIKENPKLQENEEFMLDLIDISMDYITLDRTNSKKIYAKLLRKVYEAIEEKKQNEVNEGRKNYFQSKLEAIQYCLEELNNPQLVPNGKYKIPHQFLFDAFKRNILDKFNCNRFTESKRKESAESMAETFSEVYNLYRYLDGKCDHTTGEKMAELYMNEKTDIYYHCPNDKVEGLR